MSKRPARLPPTWRWIVTALMTNSKFLEPMRPISPRASSIGRPSRVSVRTRSNSLATGSCPRRPRSGAPGGSCTLPRGGHGHEQSGRCSRMCAGACARGRRRRSTDRAPRDHDTADDIDERADQRGEEPKRKAGCDHHVTSSTALSGTSARFRVHSTAPQAELPTRASASGEVGLGEGGPRCSHRGRWSRSAAVTCGWSGRASAARALLRRGKGRCSPKMTSRRRARRPLAAPRALVEDVGKKRRAFGGLDRPGRDERPAP